MACYYIVISSTHLSNGHFRNIKGVFRGPLCKNGNKNLDYAEKEKTLAKALEDLKANFYCQLCDKQYYKHQEFDNHINSYDHAHKQRLKELKQREFARNVASKSRKDERKQERALRRLHELAEQRREVQCAPGSGPMFKSTTVAVEGSFRESCCDAAHEENQSCAAQDLGDQIHSSSCGLASKQSQWPYNGRAKVQTFRRKIAFSFSFPKKASVKLESSAAVFCESMEEGSMERSRRQRLRAPHVELDLPSSPMEEKVLNCEEAIYSTGTQQGKHFQKSDRAGSQGSSDTPVMRESPSSTASDLCALLVYSEDVPSPAVSPLNTSPFHLNRSDIVLDSEASVESLKSSISESKPETSEDVKVEENGITEEGHLTISEPPEEIFSDVPPKNDSPQQQEQVEDATTKTPYPFTKPSQPFFSVLSRDGNTNFQWPSEMVTFTRTEPSLSFSCNPLHFDFKRSRIKRSTDTQEMTEPKTDEELSLCSSFKSCHSDKHVEESTASPRNSPGQGPEGKVRKCYQYSSDTESCVGLKTHDRCRHSKDWIHASKRAEEKLRARDRRHYRSHCKKKRRRRKRRRDRHRETESNIVKSKKFHRRPECVEGLDSQFRGTSSQQVHPLEKSKQSAQNQAEDSSIAPLVEEGVGGRRQEAADNVNGSAGCIILSDEFCADSQKVLGNSREKSDNPAAGEQTTTRQCTHSKDASHSQRSSASEGCREETPPLTKTGPYEGQTSKRRRTDSLSDGDESYNPCQSPAEIPDGCTDLTCCEHGTRRKRQRRSHVQDQITCLATECPIVTNSVLEEQDKAAEESSTKCLVLKGVCDSSNGSDQISCSIDDGESGAVDSQTFTSISSALGHTVEKNSDWQRSSSSQINASCTKGSLTLLETDSMFSKEPTKENRNIHRCESKAAQTPLKNCNMYSVAAQACLLDVRDLALQRTEKATHDKSCQHSLQTPQQRFHLGIQAEEKLSRECFHTTSSLFQPSPTFQTPSDGMERRCLLQIQSHGQVLHQQVFPTKLKSVLPRPHLPMSSAVLHPVHLSSSVPSGSITIRHTILQHHTAFLPPQPPIYPQVVPVSRLPLRPEICPSAGPSFVTPPQVQVVAPPNIHPMTVTFHALPRPAVFPPMLPPHSAVIPLQPLF
ncbi:zinc finger protein 804A isoform X1 [Carassius carassius]|uniref:zinc finger protein 804A isoform X1 n=1 Tax=Carassius carassius TaxID=217509 RepID=UPI002868FB29|nr:zinc finger protein 804A isoform X1 [Carassius carassius]